MTLGWRDALIGVTAYLLFMVFGAPAAKVLPRVQPEGVRIVGVEGSLWSGQAALVSVAPVQLNRLHWQFRPLALLVGELGFALEADWLGRPVQADVGRSFFGEPRVSDVRGRIAAADLLRMLRVPQQVGLAGELDFDISDVEWPEETGYPALQGNVTWSPARIVTPVQLELGKAQLETWIEDDGITRGKLVTEGGTLLVEADVELNPGGAYRLDARLQQKGDMPPAVGDFLSSFAEYRNGTYRLEWSDSI